MSPLMLSILIHYHCFPSDFRNGDFTAPAVRKAINYFLQNNLLKEASDTNDRQTLEPTEGCHLFVRHLCDQPLPTLTMKWGF